jgi:probable F420-dependent oxidoreductase
VKFGFLQAGVLDDNYVPSARWAEEAGFESVWVPEHVFIPADIPKQYPYSRDGTPPITSDTAMFDPFCLLSFIAAATTTIRFGTYVYILPLRHPLVTARAALTIDRLSGGRLILGVGVGWLQTEFDVLRETFGDRGQRSDEIIPLLRRIWSEPVIAHEGEYYTIPPMSFEPKPRAEPSIPIPVGGVSPAALRRAGTLGDGWMEVGSRDLAELGERIDTVHDHRRRADRADAPFEITVHRTAVDSETVHRLDDLGVGRIVVGPGRGRCTTATELRDWIVRTSDTLVLPHSPTP